MTEISDERLRKMAEPGGYGDMSEWLGVCQELLRRRAQDKVNEADRKLVDVLLDKHGIGSPLCNAAMRTQLTVACADLNACRAAREAVREPDEADKIVEQWRGNGWLVDDARGFVKSITAQVRTALARSRGE